MKTNSAVEALVLASTKLLSSKDIYEMWSATVTAPKPDRTTDEKGWREWMKPYWHLCTFARKNGKYAVQPRNTVAHVVTAPVQLAGKTFSPKLAGLIVAAMGGAWLPIQLFDAIVASGYDCDASTQLFTRKVASTAKVEQTPEQIAEAKRARKLEKLRKELAALEASPVAAPAAPVAPVVTAPVVEQTPVQKTAERLAKEVFEKVEQPAKSETVAKKGAKPATKKGKKAS